MRMLRRAFIVAAIGFAFVQPVGLAQSEFANLIDHVHLAAPDQPKAVEWYLKQFGGQAMT